MLCNQDDESMKLQHKFVEIKDISMCYQTKSGMVNALENISIDIDEGDFVCLVGPSGCGKSTLLNLLAGFIYPSSGAMFVAGSQLNGPGPDRAVVFQKHALLPWLNVEENVAFGLRLRGVDRIHILKIVGKCLAELGLEEFTKKNINELSGGMQQRVGIARALASGARILLMDEPFGALDAFSRKNAQTILKDTWNKEGNTVIFVTHSISEAMYLGTKCVLLKPRPGQVEAVYDLREKSVVERDIIAGDITKRIMNF